MSAHDGDKCSYCGGAIPDGDLWESLHTNTIIRGEVYGAREAWAAAAAHVEKEAAAAFLSKSRTVREQADLLRSVADALRVLGKEDEERRESELNTREVEYPFYADAQEKL